MSEEIVWECSGTLADYSVREVGRAILNELDMLRNRIAELEEQAWNLNLENERMEEAYWIDESIAPDGTLKPSVRKLLERLEKAETDLRLGDDLVKALDNRIAELEEAQRWIPVSERLPEKYRDETGEYIPFLVCEGDGGYPFRAMYDGINWGDGMFVPDITHWMPLPELPEVQE